MRGFSDDALYKSMFYITLLVALQVLLVHRQWHAHVLQPA